MKPEVKIKNWFVYQNRLYGLVNDHPVLGNCKDGMLASSRIVKIETENTVYVMDGEHGKPNDFKESKMLVKE